MWAVDGGDFGGVGGDYNGFGGEPRRGNSCLAIG